MAQSAKGTGILFIFCIKGFTLLITNDSDIKEKEFEVKIKICN